jgi:hypothetical protein
MVPEGPATGEPGTESFPPLQLFGIPAWKDPIDTHIYAESGVINF